VNCVTHGSYGQGKSGKSRYQGANVNKDAEKILNCFTQTAYNSSQFFFQLTSFTDYLYVHF